MTGSATIRELPAVPMPGAASGDVRTRVPDLYCFPHAGGSVTTFGAWSGALGGRVRVHAVGYPAAGPGDEDGIVAAARAIADRLRPDPDAVFLGHSMGCLVAFETIRELDRRGLRGPATLVVAAHAAPHLAPQHPPLHQLPSDRFWQEVALMGGTQEEVLRSAELRQATEPRLRADFAACETYRFTSGSPLGCDVLALAGLGDTQAPPASMAPWRLHTLGNFRLETRPGGHFFVHDDPLAVFDEWLEVLPGRRRPA